MYSIHIILVFMSIEAHNYLFVCISKLIGVSNWSLHPIALSRQYTHLIEPRLWYQLLVSANPMTLLHGMILSALGQSRRIFPKRPQTIKTYYILYVAFQSLQLQMWDFGSHTQYIKLKFPLSNLKFQIWAPLDVSILILLTQNNSHLRHIKF